MNLRRWKPLAAALLPLSVACVESGCLGGGAGGQEVRRESTISDQALQRRTAVVRPGSTRDVKNHHLAILKIILPEDGAQALGLGEGCSGVLIAPRLVVTAGHCVCGPRQLTRFELNALKGGGAPGSERRKDVFYKYASVQGQPVRDVIDGSRCLKSVEVEARIYEPREPGKPARSQELTASGKVRSHPQLEILYSEEGSMVWSSADLAVIILDVALEEVPVMGLPEAEVQVGDAVEMAGYGPGTDSGRYGDRHVGRNEVRRLRRLESGSVEIITTLQRLANGADASHVERGDSGGGCWIRAENDRKVLVGITSAKVENKRGEVGSVFTSVHSHIDWLRKQMDGS